MNIQNDLKVFQIASKVLTPLKIKTKIFRGFLVFDYPLWRKTKTRKQRKSTESLRNKKKNIVNSYHTRQLLKKDRICYFSTIFAVQ